MAYIEEICQKWKYIKSTFFHIMFFPLYNFYILSSPHYIYRERAKNFYIILYTIAIQLKHWQCLLYIQSFQVFILNINEYNIYISKWPLKWINRHYYTEKYSYQEQKNTFIIFLHKSYITIFLSFTHICFYILFTRNQ